MAVRASGEGGSGDREVWGQTRGLTPLPHGHHCRDGRRQQQGAVLIPLQQFNGMKLIGHPEAANVPRDVVDQCLNPE